MPNQIQRCDKNYDKIISKADLLKDVFYTACFIHIKFGGIFLCGHFEQNLIMLKIVDHSLKLKLQDKLKAVNYE